MKFIGKYTKNPCDICEGWKSEVAVLLLAGTQSGMRASCITKPYFSAGVSNGLAGEGGNKEEIRIDRQVTKSCKIFMKSPMVESQTKSNMFQIFWFL